VGCVARPDAARVMGCCACPAIPAESRSQVPGPWPYDKAVTQITTRFMLCSVGWKIAKELSGQCVCTILRFPGMIDD